MTDEKANDQDHRSAEEPSICIVLINWNQLQLTLDCLESLFKMTYQKFKVVIVDNDSHEDPTAFIKSNYPKASVLRQSENLGFAEGNNVGFRYAYEQGFDLIMALNNDTVVHQDFLWPLVGALQDQKLDLTAVTPKIYFKHAPETIWALGGKVNFAKAKGHSYKRKTKDRGQFNELIEPDYLTGCCLLIHAKTLQQFDGFNKDYFAYYEDTDLSFRLREKGHRLMVIPTSVIWHVAGGSSRSTKKKAPFLTYLGIRNRVMFFRRHTLGLRKVYVLGYIFLDTLVDILFHLITLQFDHATQYVKGFRAGLSMSVNP